MTHFPARPHYNTVKMGSPSSQICELLWGTPLILADSHGICYSGLADSCVSQPDGRAAREDKDLPPLLLRARPFFLFPHQGDQTMKCNICNTSENVKPLKCRICGKKVGTYCGNCWLDLFETVERNCKEGKTHTGRTKNAVKKGGSP